MAEITELSPKREAGLVPILIELLARAQRGEIESIALAYLVPDSNDFGVWFSDAPGLRMVGAVTDLQHTLLRRLNGLQTGGANE